MQTPSTLWKQTLGCYDTPDRPKFVPVSYVEVEYKVTDPEAQRSAVATENDGSSWSNVAQITTELDKTYINFPTLELNNWLLDGTEVLVSDPIEGDTGFVSAVLSGADGMFTARPVITVTFDKVYTETIPGVTVKWSAAYGQWATDFAVRVYNGEEVVKEYTVTDNTQITSMALEDISGYDRIEVEIIKWSLPYARARVEEILAGIIKVYDKSNLMGFEHINSADILSLSLPENSVVFSLSNVTQEWNPDNPTGNVKYLIETQQINVKYGFKLGDTIEWIKGGTYYMSGWDTPSNGITANFEAASLLGFMDATYVVSNTTLTLKALAEDALTQAELPVNSDGTAKWSIDESLAGITVTLPEDFKRTLAQVVQLCANAACCVVRIDRGGNVIIEKMSDTLTDYLIDQFVSYQNAEYSLSKPLKAVAINDDAVTLTVGNTGEVQRISNELIQDSTAVAEWVRDSLVGRKTLSGDFRADPRLDALDMVTVKNKYATNTVVVTDVKYTYNGAFRGEYKGRVVS